MRERNIIVTKKSTQNRIWTVVCFFIDVTRIASDVYINYKRTKYYWTLFAYFAARCLFIIKTCKLMSHVTKINSNVKQDVFSIKDARNYKRARMNRWNGCADETFDAGTHSCGSILAASKSFLFQTVKYVLNYHDKKCFKRFWERKKCIFVIRAINRNHEHMPHLLSVWCLINHDVIVFLMTSYQ